MSVRLEDLKILVVEDEPPIRDLIAKVLDPLKHSNIFKARSTEHGLVLCATQQYDLIIVEFDIDPTNGIMFTQELRNFPAGANHKTPILMMASYMSEQAIEEAVALGVTDLLMKPFSFDYLVKHINYIVSNA